MEHNGTPVDNLVCGRVSNTLELHFGIRRMSDSPCRRCCGWLGSVCRSSSHWAQRSGRCDLVEVLALHVTEAARTRDHVERLLRSTNLVACYLWRAARCMLLLLRKVWRTAVECCYSLSASPRSIIGLPPPVSTAPTIACRWNVMDVQEYSIHTSYHLRTLTHPSNGHR